MSGPSGILQGRYRILSTIGRGGMGAVFLCQDLRLAGRQWAVKEMMCPDPQLLEEARRNFEREARILSALRHRSLPQIVDYFEEGGREYLVMEYVEGDTLTRVIEEEGPAGEAQAMRWGLELARVLDYLHTQNPPIIFRDLKPDNIIVTEGRHLKLVDFGLARHFDPRKDRDTYALGSIGYAPPEQWEDAAQTDVRSDLYSLGATLYYILSGRPPSPVYGTHRLRHDRPDLRRETEELVLRCMDPQPEKRYSSAGEVIRELLFLLSRSPEAPPPLRPLETPSPRAPARRESGRFAKTRTPTGGRSARAEAVPSWLTALVLLASILFLAGAALGWGAVDRRASPTLQTSSFDIPGKRQARRLLSQGDYSRAAALLDRLVTRHPADAEARILHSNVYALLVGRPVRRIPALMTMSGVGAPEGFRLLHGLAQAQVEVNRAGGVEGKLVVFDLFDDQSQTRRALELAREIAANPRYSACLGPFNSQRTLAVAPIFNAAHMPALAPVAADPRVWEAGPCVFTASDSHDPRVKALARRFIAVGLRRAAVLIDRDNVLSRSMAGYFRDEFQALGGEVVAAEAYSEDTRDFSVPIAGLKRAGAELVFLSDYRANLAVRFARQLRASGSRIPIACQVGPFSSELVRLGGEAVEGMLLSGTFHPQAPDPRLRRYVESYRQLFGELEPTHLGASAYDAAKLLLTAYAQGFDTRRELRDYLASIGDSRPPYRGVTGTFALARRLDARKVYLIEIRDGRYHLLEQDTPLE